MGKINSRTKGAVYEREVAKILTEHGFESRRGCQFSGGKDSPDVVSEFPFHIEAKRVEKLNLENAFQQSVKDSGGEKPPCVIHRKNRGENLITLRLADFLEQLTNKTTNE